LRYQEKAKVKPNGEPDQYQLFHTPEYTYRVFVTNLDAAIDVVGFYRQRAGADNLIKKANNDAAWPPTRRRDGP
jgi:hypothetical protein